MLTALALTLTLVLAFGGAAPPKLSGLDEYFITATRAYAIKPSVPVASGPFSEIQWSPGGKYILARLDRDPLASKPDAPAPSTALILTPQGQIFRRVQVPAVYEHLWVSDDGTLWGGNDEAYGIVSNGPERRWPGAVQARSAGVLADGAFAIPGMDETRLRYPDGREATISHPQRWTFVHWGRLWSSSEGEERAYDPATRTWQVIQRDFAVGVVPEGEAMIAILAPMILGKTLDPKTTMVLSRDADLAEVSPHEDMVAFVTRGALLVRRIVPVDRAAAIETRDAALREQYMAAGRQIGRAMADIQGNFQDQMPPDWATFIPAFVRTVPEPILKRFVSQYPGGPLLKLPNFGQTLMGYFPAPGGRVNVYADGRSEWSPAPGS